MCVGGLSAVAEPQGQHQQQSSSRYLAYISFLFSAKSRCWAKSQLGYMKSPAGRERHEERDGVIKLGLELYERIRRQMKLYIWT